MTLESVDQHADPSNDGEDRGAIPAEGAHAIAHTGDMMRAALDLAERFGAVFPCKPRDKTPLTRHGFKDGTGDPKQIQAWWAKWPDANIGIVTGSASGLLVIDVDPRNGGDATFARLGAEHGPIGPTLRARTGGGGFHVFLRMPDNAIRQGKDVLGPGVDLKGDGGYVIAPPSLHPSGTRYAWESEAEPATCPAWVATLAAVRTQPTNGAPSTNGAGAALGRVEVTAVRSALADPQTVARLLGLLARAKTQGNGGLLIRCPAHDDESPSCSLTRGPDGTLRVKCFACDLAGDILHLVAAVERLDVARDFPKVLARAAELAGVGSTDPDVERPAIEAEPPAERWEPPVPFDDRNLPAFPVDVLPPWLGAFVAAECEALQVPPDLPALLALGVVALALAKKVKVEIKPGWQEPANIYTVIALPPADRKSPVFRDVVGPVYEHERAEAERLAPIIAEAHGKAALAEAREKVARDRAAKAKPDERAVLEREHEKAVAASAAIHVPAEPRFIVDDATPEAVAVRLHEQSERLGVFSAEGGPFEIIAGRYSDTPNLDLFLKGWCGDPCPVDRIGRPGFMLRAPALTIALTVQPEVIRGLADKPGFRGRGLLARFLYAVPCSRVGSRDANPSPVPPHVRAAYARGVDRLLCLPAEQDEHGEIAARLVLLDAEARTMLNTAGASLERRLGPAGDLSAIGDWAGKLMGTLARIALLLHVADRQDPEAALSVAVDADTMARALRIGEYLVPHAVAAFGAMGAAPAIDDAKALLAWLEKAHVLKVSRRDIQAGMRRLRTPEKVDPAIGVLVKRGYLRPARKEHPGPGRPPVHAYEVHPCCQQRQHNSGSA